MKRGNNRIIRFLWDFCGIFTEYLTNWDSSGYWRIFSGIFLRIFKDYLRFLRDFSGFFGICTAYLTNWDSFGDSLGFFRIFEEFIAIFRDWKRFLKNF